MACWYGQLWGGMLHNAHIWSSESWQQVPKSEAPLFDPRPNLMSFLLCFAVVFFVIFVILNFCLILSLLSICHLKAANQLTNACKVVSRPSFLVFVDFLSEESWQPVPKPMQRCLTPVSPFFFSRIYDTPPIPIPRHSQTASNNLDHAIQNICCIIIHHHSPSAIR